MERVAQAVDETFFGQRPIASLTALVVDHYPDLGTEPLDHALALHRPERR